MSDLTGAYMGMLGGVYNFHELPIDEQMLDALGKGLFHRSLGDWNEFAMGSVGMVYGPLRGGREASSLILPLVSSAGHVMCWEGWLDNRAQLERLLRRELYGDYTEVAIVLAAYLRWGADFLSYLSGDFALSLWDPAARALLLARDPTGSHAIFYLANEVRLIWASDGALLNWFDEGAVTNDECIAPHQSKRLRSALIPNGRIRSTDPGSVVIAQDGYLQVRHYSTLDQRRQIPLCKDTVSNRYD